jgi:proline dehydrogenase
MAGPNFQGLDKGYLVNTGSTVTFGLAAALDRSKDGRFCKTAVAANIVATGTEMFLGVFQEDVDAADVATGKVVASVRMSGISRAISGGAITVGAAVTIDAAGKFVAAATAAGTNIVGKAMTATTATDQMFDVWLASMGAQAA